ncbi:hypothetical protein ABEB36_011891 [Hypothenemus hampei]|uniref:Uncharacterized protein n=1 Tax=Hypothenemus hampei TaxID=57062 RepID=A0ABD1E9D7_HYPHA
MGNVFGPCRNEKKSESVINLSESCVERLKREESDKKPPGAELNIPENLSEKEWMIKLKCLDDAHSNTFGLTIPNFHKLADQVQSQIEQIKIVYCDSNAISQCLQKNSCCSIKCKPEMDQYIDCIDAARIGIIKERIECELKEKRKEEQEIVGNFLNSDSV